VRRRAGRCAQAPFRSSTEDEKGNDVLTPVQPGTAEWDRLDPRLKGGQQHLVDRPTCDGAVADQSSIEPEGFEAEWAASGEAALSRVDRRQFDLVVGDLRMSGIDSTWIAGAACRANGCGARGVACCTTMAAAAAVVALDAVVT
jgi:hypothetical protein